MVINLESIKRVLEQQSNKMKQTGTHYNVQHSSSSIIIHPPVNVLQHSKSSANIQQLHMPKRYGHRTIFVPHPIDLSQLGVNVSFQPIPVPTISQRIKFSQELSNPVCTHERYRTVQRSKSTSSADLLQQCNIDGVVDSSWNIEKFPSDVRNIICKALQNPDELSTEVLIELTHHIIKKAIEERRHSLPMSRLCMAIITKQTKQTFLEALLNTCRQWYQERGKALYSIQGMKSPSGTRFTSYMSFLTEIFCHLKRWYLQFQQHSDESPHYIILTLLLKCCEDCVKPPVRSLAEIEILFYVLTCIGRDLENHLPQELKALLSSVRDAFLNSSVPNIRRTLLQLIELQASHWQLPGNTVLYYYPSTK